MSENHELEMLQKRIDELEFEKEEARKAMLEARSANEAKIDFFAKMSHEIRTPMNAIIGLTELAKNHLNEPEMVMDYLDKVMVSSKTLLNIVNNVLDISAIEGDNLKIGKNPFDFKDMMTSFSSMYYALCRQNRVRFDLYLTNVTEEMLIGDQLRLNQILSNLLSYALKNTSEGDSIKLTVSQEALSEEQVTLQFVIAYTGNEIPEEIKHKTGIPTNEADVRTVIANAGSGLDLLVTNKLVQMMNGTIAIYSELVKGNTVTITLPFERVKKGSVMEPVCFKEIRALIVDDDVDTLDYIATVLERMGVSHDAATGGADAIEKIKVASATGKKYDACFVDWKMEQVDGLAVTEKIRELLDDDTLIIIVSSYDLCEVQEEAMKKGANLFLPKPLFQSTVFDVLMNIRGGSYIKKSADTATHDFTGQRILIADDTEFNLEVAVELLQMVGLTVDTAATGAEALNRFESSAPGTYGLIFMDVQMPVMDGYEATKQIRALTHADAKTIPIVAMTANAFSDDIAKSFSVGMNDHLTKPIDAELLYRTLDKYLS